MRVFSAFIALIVATLLVPTIGAASGPLAVEAMIPRDGYGLVFGYDSLWMMSRGKLLRIDPKDNGVTEIDVGSGESALADADKYRGIAIGEGAVWIPDVGNSVIYKVDQRTNTLAMTIPTFIVGAAGQIGVGAGSIWVVTFDSHDKTLTRYDAATGAQQAQIALPHAGKSVVADEGKVWVAAASEAEVYVIDPASNRVVDTVRIHAASHLLASGFGAIWIGHDSEGLVEELDGESGQANASIATGSADMESDGDITTGGGYVWMIDRSSAVAKIDPAKKSLVGVFRPPTGTLMGRRLAFGGGALWVSGTAIFRITPPE